MSHHEYQQQQFDTADADEDDDDAALNSRDDTNNTNTNTSSSSLFPIELGPVRSVCHVLLAASGLPLNILIALVIVTFRRLRRKPRNILWLGVTMASIVTLLTILLEFVASQWHNRGACRAFLALTGLGYSWLLYNLLLALIDRYVAIVHPIWYRKNKITVLRVVIAQLTGLVSIVLAIKFPFITGEAPLVCASKVPLKAHIVFAVLRIIFLSLCLVGHVVVYLKSKRYFIRTGSADGGRTLSISFPTTDGDMMQQHQAAAQLLQHQHHQPGRSCIHADSSSGNINKDRLTMRVHGGNGQMKMDATRLLLAGVLSLLIFTLPFLVSTVIEWLCFLVNRIQVNYRITFHICLLIDF